MKPSSNTNTRAMPTIPLLSLQASPKTSLIFPSSMTQPATPEPPARQGSTPNRRGLDSINVTPRRVKPIAMARTERVILSRSRERRIDDKFFNLMEGIRGVHEETEEKLKKTKEGLEKLRKEPKEKLNWDDMLHSGQYIGVRKAEKNGPMTGRAVSKEKKLHGVRQQMIGLKYEQKNQKRVVKHLTSKEQPDPASLLQPQVTSTDTKLPTAREEAFKYFLNSARQTKTFENVKSENVELNFDGAATPRVATEDENLLKFNRDQLRKLKGGLKFMNKWVMKYHPKLRQPQRVEEGSKEYQEHVEVRQEAPEKEEDNLLQTKEFTRAYSKYSESEAWKNKVYSKRQTVEERIINMDPQGEFRKRLGIPEGSTPQKSSFFLTSEEVTVKDTNETQRDFLQSVFAPNIKIRKIDLEHGTAGVFFQTPKFVTPSPKTVVTNEPSNESGRTPRDYVYVKEIDRYSSSSMQNSPRIFGRTMGDSRVSWKTMKKSLMSRENMREARSPKPKADPEKEELLNRYNRISMDCQNTQRVGKEMKSEMNRNFNELEKKMDRLGEVPIGDKVIDERLEKEIKLDIASSYVNNPQFGKILMRRFSVNTIMK